MCAVCMSFMQTGGKQTAVDDDADSHYMPHTPQLGPSGGRLAEVGVGSDALMCNELTFQHIYTRSIEWPRPCGECHAPFGGSTNACGSKVEEQNGAYNEALTLSIVAALATVFANERKLKTDLASG